jgi:lambda repressor-like predicted transcriptional regulator
MGTKQLEKHNVEKEIFVSVIREKGYSIRKLGTVPQIGYDEKTIRRALNSGRITKNLVKNIADFLGVSIFELTGSMPSLTKTELGLTEYMVVGSNLVANVIYEAIRCKTYPTLPRKADIICDKVTFLYKQEFEKMSDDFYYRTFKTEYEIFEWLNKHIKPIQEIQELNLSQREFEKGVTVDDHERDKYVFASRYSNPPDIKDDFVDLDAFIRNLQHDLILENINVDYSTF